MVSPITGAEPLSAAPRFDSLWTNTSHAADIIACQTPTAAVSREDFLARVDRIANGLKDARQPCLLATHDTLLFALAFCGVLRAGREILMPPNLQEHTLTDTRFKDATRLDDDAVLSLLGTRTAPAREQRPMDANTPVTLFTSGSTGEPKRVAKRLHQLIAEIEVLESTFGSLLGNAAVAATVPHIHIYGVLFRVLWPLAAGRTFHSDTVTGGALRDTRGQALVSSPAFLGRIDPAQLAAAQPRLVFSSGGRLPEARASELAEAAACPLIEVYGSTETGGIAWRKWPSPAPENSWTPFAGVSLRYADEASRLHVCSPATDGTWIDTGDVARPHGERLLLEGRADGVLKIEDKRISLAAMTEWLETHPWVKEARLLQLPARRIQLGAVVTLCPEGRALLENEGRGRVSRLLRDHVLQRFEAVVVPRKWRYPGILPLNALGKTTRADLLALFEQGEGT